MHKTLFILRCYSGFEESLIRKEWSPSGATTIVKLLEYVQKNKECNILLISKSNNKLKFTRNKKVILNKLSIPIYFIRGRLIFFSSTKLGKIYNELYTLLFPIYYIFKLKPKIIYADHANIFITSLIARYTSIKTVVRLMGVKDDMRDCIDGNSIYNKLLNWSYRAPFSLVLATQDGAGSDAWMEKALTDKVPRKTILNGADRNITLKKLKIFKELPINRIIIIFLGRLEEDKAPDKFLESFMIVRKKYPNKYHCLIVGSGSMQNILNKIIRRENASTEVSFFSNLNTNNIFYLLKQSNIYVSLNRYGNLSNANIEAMINSKAMIIPKSQKEKNIDIYTEKILKENTVYRVTNSDATEEVADAIIYLAKNKRIRNNLEKNIYSVSNTYIKSWEHRIKAEYKLLNLIGLGNEDDLRDYLEVL